MHQEKHLLFCEDEPVGWIVVETIDMWYWDCKFETIDNVYSHKFVSDASKLDVSSVFNNFELGIRVLIHFNGKNEQITQAIIMGLEKEMIYLRTIY